MLKRLAPQGDNKRSPKGGNCLRRCGDLADERHHYRIVQRVEQFAAIISGYLRSAAQSAFSD
jgi:hypothetical protein